MSEYHRFFNVSCHITWLSIVRHPAMELDWLRETLGFRIIQRDKGVGIHTKPNLVGIPCLDTK